MQKWNGVWGVALTAVIAVSAVSAMAQQDAPRRDRRDRMQAAGGDRRAATMDPRGGVMGGGMQRGMGAGMGRETMLANFVNNPKTAERLGLTTNQVAALSERLDAIQKEKVQVRAELEIAGMEQAKLLSADAVDEAAIGAAIDKTGAIHTRLAKLEIQPIIELKKFLSPAQIAMAKEMVRERMRERMGPQGGGPGVGPDGGSGPMVPPEPPPAPAGDGL